MIIQGPHADGTLVAWRFLSVRKKGFMYARTYSISLHWLHCLLRSGKRILRSSLNENRASLVAQRLKRLPAMLDTWVWFLGQEDPLEKEMATHSSILAWRIPWTEEPVGYSPWGSEELRHDWATSLHFHFLMGISPLSSGLPVRQPPTPSSSSPTAFGNWRLPPQGEQNEETDVWPSGFSLFFLQLRSSFFLKTFLHVPSWLKRNGLIVVIEWMNGGKTII